MEYDRVGVMGLYEGRPGGGIGKDTLSYIYLAVAELDTYSILEM